MVTDCVTFLERGPLAKGNELVDCHQRRGSLFRLLCIIHTTAGVKALEEAWKEAGVTQVEFCKFIMKYKFNRQFRGLHNLTR